MPSQRCDRNVAMQVCVPDVLAAAHGHEFEPHRHPE
jgi:hypothetical protein